MKPIYAIIIAILTALFFLGCGEDKTKQEYTARVDNSYLLKNEVELRVPDSSPARSEYIRNWVETELLYLEGIDNDILDNDDYQYLIEKSRRELVKSLWLNKFFNGKNISFTQKELETYYSNNTDAFKALSDGFYVNMISFTDESRAAKFRNTLIESNWDKASKAYINDSSIVEIVNGRFLYLTGIYEGTLLRIIESLNENEVSLVIPSTNLKYYVIQMLKKIKKGEKPPFNAIIAEVERLFIEDKKRSILDEYMKELYSKYEIEIRK